MRLTVRVPSDRSIAGLLDVRLVDRPASAPVLVCATARAGGSWRDPAYGRYLLREVRVNDAAQQTEYGPCRLVFEPEGGAALGAEARGVLTLEVHGGDAGGDGRLRRTEGGLRLANDDLMRLARLVSSDRRVELEMVEASVGWWRLVERWKRRLSAEGISDEAGTTRDDDRWGRDSSSSSSSAGNDRTWSGSGGKFAGAGSGGDWSDGAKVAAVAGAAVGAAAAAAAIGAEAASEGSTASGESSDAAGGTTY